MRTQSAAQSVKVKHIWPFKFHHAKSETRESLKQLSKLLATTSTNWSYSYHPERRTTRLCSDCVLTSLLSISIHYTMFSTHFPCNIKRLIPSIQAYHEVIEYHIGFHLVSIHYKTSGLQQILVSSYKYFSPKSLACHLNLHLQAAIDSKRSLGHAVMYNWSLFLCTNALLLVNRPHFVWLIQ